MQASALRSIRQMKHTMTPRFPPLHNRTLSGNLLDTTLGILQTPDHLEVDPSPLDTTNIAPELHAIDQDSEVDERLEVPEVPKSNSFSLQERLRENGSKTYANVRLSTESVPLQVSSISEATRLVGTSPQTNLATNLQGMTLQTNLATALQGMNEETSHQTNARTNVQTNHRTNLQANLKTDVTPTKHVYHSTHINVVDDHLSTLDVTHETIPTDFNMHVDSTPLLPVTTVSASPLPEDRQGGSGGTYTKNTPVLGDNCQKAVNGVGNSGFILVREDNIRAISEHSYAKACSEDQAERGTAAGNNTFIIGNTSELQDVCQLVSDNHSNLAAVSQEEREMETMKETTVVMNKPIESSTKDVSASNVDQRNEDGVEGSRPEDYSNLPVHSEDGREVNSNAGHHSEGVEGSVVKSMGHVHVPSVIGDQVLEVAVIEPESDIPMPVEYTVVTQQEITEEAPPPKEEAPPSPHADLDQPHLVNEDSHESGESMMIGCEVTTSTMELTDVTDPSGRNSTSTNERPAPADFTLPEDISCETVIITTSAMNSTRTGGYTTPSEDSDGTTNSLEEKETRGGDETEPVNDKQIRNMISANDDGADSDVVFEEILKQIESAPYELRISNIVLAQLSRAPSKSPPRSTKKRKRRSAGKRWTRTKSRKSNLHNVK